MAWFIFLVCVPAGVGIYWILAQLWTFLVRPLTEEIPTSAKYRPGIHPPKRKPR